MEERKQLSQSAIRYLDGNARYWWQRALDGWFAPKPVESAALYERLGVLLIKRYVPTGGDVVIRRYGVRIADIRGSLDALIRFERLTRRLEAIHELVFLAFVAFSVWRAVTHQTTLLDFGFALGVYIVLMLSPAMLQRYNRLRVYPIIRRLGASQPPCNQEDASRTRAVGAPASVSMETSGYT